MSHSLTEYIRTLTAQDKKNLTQKGLKANEEVGELSGKILSYENADATTHRIVEKRDILDECADVILCALSIAFSLDYSDEDVIDMLTAKTNKWATLQEREADAQGPIPFEIHVTVHDADVNAFKTACKALGVKPILLALQAKSGDTLGQDIMTSSVFFGNNKEALEELDRISLGLSAAGLNVVRRKIESVPWHPAAPSRKNGVSIMPPGGYFECHLNVIVDAQNASEVVTSLERLKELAHDWDGHLSSNAFKTLSPTTFTHMLTLRSYMGTREQFEARRDSCITDVAAMGFKLEKVITEFSLFDSRVSHDTAWLEAK